MTVQTVLGENAIVGKKITRHKEFHYFFGAKADKSRILGSNSRQMHLIFSKWINLHTF